MFNYSENKVSEPTIYNANLTKIRINLRSYTRGLKLPKDAVELVLDDCIDLVRHWLNSGEIKDEADEAMAIKQCKSIIFSKVNEAGWAKSKAGQAQTICWHCRNAVPKLYDGRYIRGCEWSIKRRAVPGWDAEQTTIDGNVSYKVHKCPKFKKGRS